LVAIASNGLPIIGKKVRIEFLNGKSVTFGVALLDRSAETIVSEIQEIIHVRSLMGTG